MISYIKSLASYNHLHILEEATVKKIASLILVFLLLLSFAACGSDDNSSSRDNNSIQSPSPSPSPSPSLSPSPPTSSFVSPDSETRAPPSASPLQEAEPESSVWEIVDIVDDFGDKTGDSCIVGTFLGSFSNTATSDSDLTVNVIIYPLGDPVTIDGQYANKPVVMFIRLLEYGTVPATYLESDLEAVRYLGYVATVKTRVAGVDASYEFTGSPPNGDFKFQGDGGIFRDLHDGNDVNTIIDIGSSKYKFVMNCEGFASRYDEKYGAPDGLIGQTASIEGEVTHVIENDMGYRLVFDESGVSDVFRSGLMVQFFFGAYDPASPQAKVMCGDTVTISGQVASYGLTSVDIENPSLTARDSYNAPLNVDGTSIGSLSGVFLFQKTGTGSSSDNCFLTLNGSTATFTFIQSSEKDFIAPSAEKAMSLYSSATPKAVVSGEVSFNTDDCRFSFSGRDEINNENDGAFSFEFTNDGVSLLGVLNGTPLHTAYPGYNKDYAKVG